MKVLMTTDTLGGVWTYALELCAALPDVQFILAAMGNAPTPEQRRAARLPNVLLEARECRLEWMPGGEADLAQTGAWLMKLAARHAPDLVHLNEFAHAGLAWRVPRVLVAHSCVVSWWRAVHGVDPPAAWQPYRERARDAVCGADCVIAPTHAYLREIVALYGQPRRSFAIYNARTEGSGPATALPQPRVLGAGRLWDAAKNLATLDAAAQSIDWPVYVAGERQAPHGGESACRAARPLGFLTQAQLREWMQGSAVFAAPVIYEPFGLTQLEAALRGCALVLGDLPSMRELWAGAALFVPPRDAQALATTLTRLLQDPRWRGQWSAAARRRAQLFGTRRMASAYRAVYRELTPALAPQLADAGEVPEYVA